MQISSVLLWKNMRIKCQPPKKNPKKPQYPDKITQPKITHKKKEIRTEKKIQ